MLFGDLKSSTKVVCQLLKETIQTVANGGLTSEWQGRSFLELYTCDVI